MKKKTKRASTPSMGASLSLFPPPHPFSSLSRRLLSFFFYTSATSSPSSPKSPLASRGKGRSRSSSNRRGRENE